MIRINLPCGSSPYFPTFGYLQAAAEQLCFREAYDRMAPFAAQKILVSTPFHCCDPALAIAAAQAGELGLLTLVAGGDGQAGAAALAKLRSALGRDANWGVLWYGGGDLQRACDGLAGAGAETLPYLAVAGVFSREEGDLAVWLEAGKRRADKVLLEVYGLEQADAATAAGFDGLVLKGAEAGGFVGSLSAYLWLQAAPGRWSAPWWVQGAWGEDAAAACFAQGGAPALNEELWLARESPLDPIERQALKSHNGTETTAAEGDGYALRLASTRARRAAEELVEAAAQGSDPAALLRAAWTGGGTAGSVPVPMGQGIGQAVRLADRHVAASGILQALRQGAAPRLRRAAAQGALNPDSELAARHGTRYPIVQGPMTRVSDTPEFARAVAQGGALPFLALGLMHGDELATVLRGIKEAVEPAPWGVGILGFLFPEMRRAQLEIVLRAKPQFAIVAGGRPAHAEELAAAGIEAYLHVPSPVLLGEYLDAGARKFVFEGRECGGHIGPLSSLALWQSAIEVLKEARLDDPEKVQILFAGGVHDATSAALVSVLAADLVEMGMAVGALMGTAYLFTEEAVASGAITPAFQQVAVECRATACLESAPGQVTRCAETDFAAEFRRRRAELIEEGVPSTERRHQLELLNLGRLRLAAKGQRRAVEPSVEPVADGTVADSALKAVEGAFKGELEATDETAQRREGLYMLGDVAVLEERVQTIAQLHRCVGEEAVELVEELAASLAEPEVGAPLKEAGEPIAIVGMASCFPGGLDLDQYWETLLAGRHQVRDVPPDRWDRDLFYAPGQSVHDRTYAQRGCFLDPIRFDPLKYHIPPAVVPSVEPVQLLAVELAARALADAGYDRRPFDRSRVAVVFGVAGMQEVGMGYSFRTMARQYLSQAEGLSQAERHRVMAALAKLCPAWTEDSFPGILGNVIAGRVANRLDLNGPNFTVDAACASSLAALKTAVEQLRTRSCDMAVAGAVDWSNHAFTFLSFAKTHALTPGEVARPFDAAADGIVLGEGAGVLVLKRLADARRDGDRIWAVVRGIEAASDGGSRSLTAPDADGQVLALQRAYADAGVDPVTIGLVEAHATGTRVGDREEVAALQRVFGTAEHPFPTCAIGSVKSIIGHTKTAAGIAGIIKSALALRHRILPPTANVETPTGEVDWETSPFYLNTAPRPWIHSAEEPARAGVSAFGFGGSNYHAVLEEYRGGSPPPDLTSRSAQVFFWSRADSDSLRERLRQLAADLVDTPESVRLEQLAYSAYVGEEQRRTVAQKEEKTVRLGLIAADVADLRQKLDQAIAVVEGGVVYNGPGVYFSSALAATADEVCFLYPGQGAQQPGMLQELLQFQPFGTEHFEAADRCVAEFLPRPLSTYIFPPAGFGHMAKKHGEELRPSRVAQPALAVVESFAHRVLAEFGLRPARVGGHSLGEYSALWAAGVYGLADLWWLVARRGAIIHRQTRDQSGGMLAVSADEEEVRQILVDVDQPPHIANLNASAQTILSGSNESLERVVEKLRKRKIANRRVAVSAAFHSPAMAPCFEPLAQTWEKLTTRAPELPVYSNLTAAPHSDDPAQIGESMTRHLGDTVRFAEQVRRMYQDGSRIFFEVGPGRILSGLVKRILADEPHVAIPLDQPGVDAWTGLAQTLAQAAVLGLDIDFAAWFREREVEAIPAESYLDQVRQREQGRPTDWWLTGKGAVPVSAGAWTPPAEPAPDIFTEFEEDDEEIAMDASAGPPGPPGQGREEWAEFQQTMRQWLDLQRQQLSLHERFLDLQTRALNGGTPSAPQADGLPGGGYIPDLPPQALPVENDLPVAPAASPADPPPASAVPAATGGAPPVPTAPDLGAVLPGANGATAQDQEATTPVEGEIPSTEDFRHDLLAEVSQRTGYPEDMLEMDTPLEAGLGIDSIKILEIFSALKRYHHVFEIEGGDGEELMARFVQLDTLNAVIDSYSDLRQQLVEGGGADSSPSLQPATSVLDEPLAPPAEPAQADELVARFALGLAAAPRDEGDAKLTIALEDTVLVLGGEAATRIAQTLRVGGYRVCQVEPGGSFEKLEDECFTADLGAPDQVERLRREVSVAGRVGAVINLLALCRDESDTSEGGLELTGALANVARAFAADLQASGKGGLWVNFTSLGGRFGVGAKQPLPVFQAGTIGLTKALGREWRGVRVCNVDMDADIIDQVLGPGLLDGLAAEGPIEVGLDRDGRWQLQLNSSPAVAGGPLPIDRDAVVVVTGGGYGIGAIAARSLATEVPATYVLVGRSDLNPADSEPESVRGLTDEIELRRALLAEVGQSGPPKPAAVEELLRRLQRQRALRQTVAQLEANGATVDYRKADVQDEEAFAHLIGQIYERYGRIDGVVHAAGIIEDAPLAKKTSESFARVFATKVSGGMTLARALRPEGLRFLVFFSSLSGRLGNAWQTDYCAANETLNKLAASLAASWPGRVVAINWGPWDSGLVPEGLKRAYGQRGIALISERAGGRAFVDELRQPPDAEAEVVLTCSPAQILADGLAGGDE